MQTILFTLRRKAQKPVLSLVLAAMAVTSGPVSSEAFFWDTDSSTVGNDADGSGLGGSGTWDTATGQWWDLSSLIAWPNSGMDQAIFTYAYPGLGIPVQNTVTVDAGGVNAGRISFLRSGYTLSGGAITLAGSTPTLHATLGDSATISSNLLGTAGLTKNGGGSIRLSGDNSGLTGPLSIANGTLIISNPLALPGTGAVSILTTNLTPLNNTLIGLGGGSLVLDGTNAGFTLARDINFEGRGPIGDRGAAILSLGNNTLSGTISSAVSPLPLSPTATIRNSRISSVNGTLTLSGIVNAGGTSATTVLELGGVNSAGTGNFDLTGILSGTGSISKTGGGTLFLNPSSNSDFSGTVRVNTSSTGQESTIRVTQLTVGGTSTFGANTAANAASAIDLNGGVLEFRSEGSLDFNALSSGKNVYQRANSTMFAGPGVGGQGINGTVTLGTYRVASNTTANFNSRNGYGFTLQTWTQENSNNPFTITNNMGGTLLFTGNAWNNNDSSDRTLTIGGGGNTVITGSINTSGTGVKTLAKSGAGSLTIQGVATTLNGPVNITGGAVVITDFRSLSNNGATISMNGGALVIGTSVTPNAAGLTSSKIINLSGTTGAAAIYANQAGVNPVILNADFTATGNGTKTLTLGGTSTVNNIINGAIVQNGSTLVTKIGAGTWVLAGANTYTGATTIANGTLVLQDTHDGVSSRNVLGNTNAVTFNADAVSGSAGGILEYRGTPGQNSLEALGALTPTAGAGTVKITPGVGGTAALTFTSLGTNSYNNIINFVSSATNSISVGSLAGYQSNRLLYFNGADVAFFAAGLVRAPIYGTDTDFAALNTVTSGAHGWYNTNTAINAAAAQRSIKLEGNTTLTLNSDIIVHNATSTTTPAANQGVIIATGGNAVIEGGGLLRTPSTQALGIQINGASDSLTINTSINNATPGTGGITKSGLGTLYLNGTANNNTGEVRILEGSIVLGTGARLGGDGSTTGNALRIHNSANSTTASRLDLGGNSIFVGALNGNGVITTNGGTATLSVGLGTGTGTWNGTFENGTGGVLSVSKIGTGNQTWSGLSTYTGVTTIGSTGLVTVDYLADIGQDSGIGRGDATSDATNAASLVFNGSTGGLRYRGDRFNGNLTVADISATTNRLFTLAASATGARIGSTVGLNNAIIWSSTGAIVNNTTANAILDFEGDSAGDNTFNPRLVDSSVGGGVTLSVTKSGTGQWNLGNSGNSYTGATTVANGILGLSNTGALPAGSPLVLGSTTTTGILQTSGTLARDLSATPTAGTGTLTWGGTTGGGGFAAHTTPLTVTLNSGTGLTWGSGGFVGTGGVQSLVFGSASALSDVTFTNAIDLGASIRTVTVNANTNTGTDFATLSGVLSGTGGGLLKNGAAPLRLTGANTYTGTTNVEAGTIVVSSLGGSTGPATSSVGASGVTMNDTNAIVLGNATTTGGILQYVGPGEISDRKIRLRGTTANNQIHADGSGALILTNVAHDTTETGNKTLSLRGSNTAGNMITSALTNNVAGILTVTVDGGATWILTNSGNTYSGDTNANAGALGIGGSGVLGTGTLVFNNGNIFAYGADRTVGNAVNLLNNTTVGFLGDYSLTFTQPLNLRAAANNVTTSNSVAAGKTVTFNGGVTNTEMTGNRAWVIDGTGETVINGDFTSTTAFGVRFDINGGGTLTLGTNGATSNWNKSITAVDVDRGTLKFSADNAIPTVSAAYGGIILSPELATGDTAAMDLNGTTQTINSLTATSNGILVLDNTSATAATFRFGANNTDINFGGTAFGTVAGTGSYTITDSGAGALSIVKLGTTTTTFGSHVVLTHQGTTAVEGGTFNIAANLNGTTGLIATNSGTVLNLSGGANLGVGSVVSATGGGSINTSVNPVNFGIGSTITASGTGSSLNFTGGIGNASDVVSLVLANGTTLSLLDGEGSKFSDLTNLQIGSSGGTMTTLSFNVGDQTLPGDGLFTDTLTLLTGGVLSLFSGNQITFNLTDTGLNANQQYVLLDATAIGGGLLGGGPLSISDYLLGATPGGFTSINLTANSTTNQIILTTGNLITGDLFWRGSAGGGTDNTWNANAANWSLDKANTSVATSIPGQGTDVRFAIDSASGVVTTTLEQNFKINSLTFEAGTSTPVSVTIAPGAASTNRLEVAPQLATDGVSITAGGPAEAIISAPFRLGANQTWTVADAASVLTFSGGLQGERNVTKEGAGRVVLAAAADPTFNSGQTATFTVNAGTLEMTNLAALGYTTNSNAAAVSVGSGGAFYYNNTTATTAGAPIANAITLGGATLSLGGANHFIGPMVTVTADSMINLRDSNSATLTTVARNLTLNNGLTGTGNLTVDSTDGGTAINQIAGTLTLNQNNSAWSGDLTLLRGSVATNNANGLGSGSTITFERGRIQLTAGAGTPTIAQNITIARAGGAAIGEFNLAAGIATAFSGDLTLGGTGGSGELRVFMTDDAATAAFTGGVVLANDGLIGTQNGGTRLAEFSGVISETGGARTLTINDAAWGGTAGIVRLTGVNTFTGNVTISRGTLQFNTVTNISGGASALGNGTALTMGAATLSFIGSGDQSTNRPITTTGSAVLAANGTDGAAITYHGAITQAANNTLTLAGTGAGVITGGITQPAGAASADLSVTGGTWTVQDTNATIADDLLVSGGSLTLKDMVLTLNDDVVVTGGVLNLNTTGVLAATSPAGTSTGIHARTGGVINLGANDIFGAANSGGLDFINVGDSGAGAAGVFNTNTFNITSPGLLVGGVAAGLEGNVTGTGTITVSGTAVDWGTNSIRAHRGTISANLAGVASLLKQGLGEMILSGDNSGLTGTVAATRLDAGSLVLDYTTQNNNKISAVAQLDMRGASLTLNGNNSAASSQTVASFTLANASGANRIVLNNGTGSHGVVLNLGAMTRAVNSQDGTLRIVLPSGVQSATNGVTTSTGVTGGILGTAAFATVEDGTGTWFATKSGSNIVALASTPKNDVSTWLAGDHITDETTGFTGTYANVGLNSLRFDAVGGSDINLGITGVLGIATGGILVTDNVGGTPSITGGTLFSGAAAATPELIVTHDSASTFEIGSDIRVNTILIKTGTGTLLLSGNNTATGLVEIQNGTLQLSGGNAIGDNTLVTLSDDKATTLQLLADETIGRLAGGSTTDGLRALATVDVGAYTLTTNTTGGNATYSGKFIGSGTIVKNGFGTNTNWNLNNISDGFSGTVVVNGGLLQLSNIGRIDASAFVINKNGSVLLDNSTATSSGTRILDTASITLNSADGAASGETRPSGIWIRRDQGSAQNETVGVLSINSGASYTRLEGTAANAVSTIIADNIIRANSSTLNVRGTNMTATTGQRGQLRIGTTGNQTTFMSANMVGGGGALGTKTISIIPWAIAEETAAAVGDAHMGNSFASYVSGVGFRALNLTTEYDNYAAAVAQSNTRESLAADLTGLNGKTINSLVLHNSSNAPATTYSVTGSGAGQTLALTSGAMLFTLNPVAVAGAYGINLGGFDSGITVGGTNEFVIHVVNPSSAIASVLTATISSNLISSADITKAGRGTLILSGTNTAGGGARRTTLNEGILEIADLDNIGGNTGVLVFAGGTLRLSGVYTGDDLSSRTISFLQAGGTLDTNGIDLALANSLGSGAGGFTKTGAGNLTLNGAATYTGNSVLALGTVTVGANNALGNGGNLSLAAGTTLALGTSSLTHGLVSTAGAGTLITGTGTISASTGFFFSNTDATQIDAILAGAGGLFKNQTNTLTLAGLNTYTGTTEIQAGTLSFDSISNVNGGASALGNAANAENGIIRMGLTTAATTLTYTGSGHLSDRLIGMQGTTGGVTLNGNGTGSIGFGGARFEMAGNKTLTLRGTSDPAIINTIGALTEIGGVLTLLKTDSNTWNLSQTNSYTGATSIDNGILRLSAAQNLTGALNFGSANTIITAGKLEVNENAAFGPLTVQTNSAVNTNLLEIASGKSLTINGNATIGTGVGALSTTMFEVFGAGTLNITNLVSAAQFRVGGSAGNGNVTTADMSALANLNVSLNTTNGIVRVNSTSGTNVNDTFSVFELAQDSTLTAATLAVGDGGQYNGSAGQINRLLLGTGSTILNVNTINIGTGARDLGSITFQDTTGTLTVRAADGVGAAAFNMGAGTANTAVALPSGNRNTFDVTGHSADILFGAVNIGTQNARTGAMENLFAFDTGTLATGNLTMGSKTAAGNSTNVMNLGGGTITIGSGTGTAATLASNTSTGAVSSTINVTAGTVTIGSGSGQALILANSNTNATGSSTGALNISGGAVILATTGATAVTLANASAGTSTGSISVTGGSLTSQGAILSGTGAGTRNASVTLDGGLLDMSGHAIGASGNSVVLNALSGTLRNLGELNGGGTLDKTTAGTLILDTSNSYTGATTVSAGVLQVSHGGALGGTAAGTTVADGAVLELSGNITTTNEALTLNGSGISDGGALRNTSGNNTYAGNITLATASRINSDSGLLTLDATTGAAIVAVDQNLTLGGAGNITVADAITLGTGNLVKDGAGTVILSGDNSYTGTTTVSDGLLMINGDSSLATGAVTVASGATLGGSGTIGSAASTATIASGGTLTGGNDGSSGTAWELDPLVTDAVGTLSFGGNLTASSGSIWLVDLVQGGTADLINVGGALSITGSNLAINFGGAFVEHQVYTIASYGGGLTGTFAGLGEGAFVDPGNLYRINYGTGPSGAITLTAVPEPGTLGMLGLALGGFFVRRIRRRRAAAAAVTQGQE